MTGTGRWARPGRNRTLARSFRVAFEGFRHAVATQRTLRVHLAIAAGVALLVIWLPLSAVEAGVVLLAVAIVLAAEMFNTGVEAIVDLLVGANHHGLAKIAKDISAAAVLLTAVAAALAGILILGPHLGAAIGLGPVQAAVLARGAAILLVLLAVVSLVRLLLGAHPGGRLGEEEGAGGRRKPSV